MIIYVTGFCAHRYHHLKLYPEDESGPQNTKKPVVVETYNEIVFPEPSEVFLARVLNHPAVVVPKLPVGLNLPSPGMFLACFDQLNRKGKAGDIKLSLCAGEGGGADPLCGSKVDNLTLHFCKR